VDNFVDIGLESFLKTLREPSCVRQWAERSLQKLNRDKHLHDNISVLKEFWAAKLGFPRPVDGIAKRRAPCRAVRA